MDAFGDSNFAGAEGAGDIERVGGLTGAGVNLGEDGATGAGGAYERTGAGDTGGLNDSRLCGAGSGVTLTPPGLEALGRDS